MARGSLAAKARRRAAAAAAAALRDAEATAAEPPQPGSSSATTASSTDAEAPAAEASELPKQVKREGASGGEPPRKVARLLPSDVPQDRLRAELQRLLAGADLGTVTVGKLRGQLETNLGLESGMLSASKRMARWTCGVFQQEVLKKADRSPKCEMIAEALAGLPGYPVNCRRMLIEGLVHATAVPQSTPDGGSTASNGSPRGSQAEARAPHLHQVRFLEIARDALEDERRSLSERAAASERDAETVEVVRRQREVSRGEAQAAEARALEDFEAKERSKSEADEATKRTKEDFDRVVQAHTTAAKDRRVVEVKRAAVLELTEQSLRPLLEGRLDGSDKEEAITRVATCLQDLDSEDTLRTAAHTALAVLPNDRGAFLTMTCEAVEAALKEGVQKLDRELEATIRAQDKATVLAAEALHEAMVQRNVAKILALADSREALEAARALRSTEDSEVQQLEARRAQHIADRDQAAARVARLVEVVATVEELMRSTAGPQSANAAGASLAEAGTDEDAEAAELPQSQQEEHQEAPAAAPEARLPLTTPRALTKGQQPLGPEAMAEGSPSGDFKSSAMADPGGEPVPEPSRCSDAVKKAIQEAIVVTPVVVGAAVGSPNAFVATPQRKRRAEQRLSWSGAGHQDEDAMSSMMAESEKIPRFPDLDAADSCQRTSDS